jgi:hypothetical protein
VGSWEPKQATVQINAVPNPFITETQLIVKGQGNSFPMLLQLFDSQGKKVLQMKDEGGVFRLKKGDLNAGVYLFNIQQNGQVIGNGKLILQG